MNLPKRRRYRGLISLAAAPIAVMGLSQMSASAATSMTLTEMDYFTTALAPLNAYVKQFEATHPGVKVVLSHTPSPTYETKVLTDASGHDLPNIVMADNPYVPTAIATGEMVPLSSFKGFSTKGYYKGVIDEGLSDGKYYELPVAGENSLALFYNIPMFKAAHLSPPKTWAQLLSDAKALTTKKVYGMVMSAPATEECTWQWEPFYWSDGGDGNFANISGPPGVQALDLWATLVKDGYASKGVLTYDQVPDVIDQFAHGDAAMMVGGQWNFPELNAVGKYYGKQFGVVPIPVRVPGQKVVAPLGGEDFMVSDSGTKAQQQMAFEFIEGLQTPSEELTFAKAFGYLPATISVAHTFLKTVSPEWSVFVNETINARPRTLDLGTKYAKISEAVWTAIDAALSGTQSVPSALKTAQRQINAILKG